MGICLSHLLVLLQSITPVDSSGNITYLERLLWLVVQPAKAWCECKVRAHKNKGGGAMMALLRSRHSPPAYNDILKVYNELGPILPVSQQLHETMPYLYYLLTLNPFSEVDMVQYLDRDAHECGIQKGTSEWKSMYKCMYSNKGGIGANQISNMPMMIMVLIFLQNGTSFETDTPGSQHVLRFTSKEDYRDVFNKASCQGLTTSTKPADDIEWWTAFNRQAGSTYLLPDTDTTTTTDRYCLLEVIIGLLYLPNRLEQLPGENEPRLFDIHQHSRKEIDDYLAKFFCLNDHFYETILKPTSICPQKPEAPVSKEDRRQILADKLMALAVANDAAAAAAGGGGGGKGKKKRKKKKEVDPDEVPDTSDEEAEVSHETEPELPDSELLAEMDRLSARLYRLSLLRESTARAHNEYVYDQHFEEEYEGNKTHCRKDFNEINQSTRHSTFDAAAWKNSPTDRLVLLTKRMARLVIWNLHSPASNSADWKSNRTKYYKWSVDKPLFGTLCHRYLQRIESEVIPRTGLEVPPDPTPLYCDWRDAQNELAQAEVKRSVGSVMEEFGNTPQGQILTEAQKKLCQSEKRSLVEVVRDYIISEGQVGLGGPLTQDDDSGAAFGEESESAQDPSFPLEGTTEGDKKQAATPDSAVPKAHDQSPQEQAAGALFVLAGAAAQPDQSPEAGVVPTSEEAQPVAAAGVAASTETSDIAQDETRKDADSPTGLLSHDKAAEGPRAQVPDCPALKPTILAAGALVEAASAEAPQAGGRDDNVVFDLEQHESPSAKRKQKVAAATPPPRTGTERVLRSSATKQVTKPVYEDKESDQESEESEEEVEGSPLQFESGFSDDIDDESDDATETEVDEPGRFKLVPKQTTPRKESKVPPGQDADSEDEEEIAPMGHKRSNKSTLADFKVDESDDEEHKSRKKKKAKHSH